jgi:hypothetical protein
MASQSRGSLPSDIANLGLWLKADAGVTLVGGAVDAWADQSGNGRDFSAPAGTNRPAYSGTLNGLPVLTFDGSTDYLSGDADSLTLARNVSGLTVIALFKDTSTTDCRVFGISTNTAAARFTMGGNGTNWLLGTRRLDADGVNTVTGGTQGTEYTLLSALARYSVATRAIFEDGVSVVDTSGGTAGNTQDTSSQISTIGCGTALGNFLAGSVAEIIVYQRALSDAERQSVERYLSVKWGIVI